MQTRTTTPYLIDQVRLELQDVTRPGTLTVPPGALGVVAFAHGRGSGRRSPRDNAVARTLERAGIATLLVDLLTDREATDPDAVFDVGRLSARLLDATRWLAQRREVAGLPMGLFGARAGGAAALQVAAVLDHDVAAVVARGARPDLVERALPAVSAPTLLIVGGRDATVLDLNLGAFAEMTCDRHLEVVPDASHMFTEPGALDRVATLTRDWFAQHCSAPVTH